MSHSRLKAVVKGWTSKILRQLQDASSGEVLGPRVFFLEKISLRTVSGEMTLEAVVESTARVRPPFRVSHVGGDAPGEWVVEVLFHSSLSDAALQSPKTRKSLEAALLGVLVKVVTAEEANTLSGGGAFEEILNSPSTLKRLTPKLLREVEAVVPKLRTQYQGSWLVTQALAHSPLWKEVSPHLTRKSRSQLIKSVQTWLRGLLARRVAGKARKA